MSLSRQHALHTALVLVLWVTVPAGSAGAQSLIDAVRGGDAEAVRALLASAVDVDARQGDGATALQWAVSRDAPDLIDLLIRAGADVNASNDLGATPLYLACRNRSAATVSRLLASGADPNATLLGGETALMTCSRTGDADAVRALAEAGARVDAREPSHDQTALMWAAAQGHAGAVEALLRHGANPSARSRVYSQTVTSEVTQRAGREELNYTVRRGGSTALLFAARSGDVASARLLLEAGAAVDEVLPDGTTALVLAAHSGHGALATLLLEQGADPDAAGIGYTALHAAVLRRDAALVRVLLAHGANADAPITKGTPMRRTSQDFNLPAVLLGATPYLLAAKFLEPEMMDALHQAGADPRRPMRDGETPLMAAAGMGAPPQADRRGLSVLDGGEIESEDRVLTTVRRALDLGSDVNAANEDGDTALHVAATREHDGLVRLLVERGGRLDIANRKGQTPLAALLDRLGTSWDGRTSTTVELMRRLGAAE